MYISHKTNVLQQVHETEWQCRRNTKGMSKPEYWAWEETIKDSDGVPDYSGETGYTIVECTDEDVEARLVQLSDYISTNKVYNIKWSDEKVDGSHFTGDDDAKDARLLAEEWTQIRAERDRLLAETDWMMLSDTGTVSAAWKNYRKALREIPQSQDSAKTFADITWPTKPSS
jgi:hypothetical protein